MRSIPPSLPAGTKGLLSLRLVKRLESQPAFFLSHSLAQHKVLARGGLPRLALVPVLNTDVIVGKLLLIAFEFVYCGHDPVFYETGAASNASQWDTLAYTQQTPP